MIYKFFKKLFTKNETRIPLFYVFFDGKHYKKFGEEKSCMIHIHPTLEDDEFIKNELKGLINYIRSNYDMEDL